MAVALSIDLIQATVQVEQPLGDGTRTVGTGFLISDPTPDGKPRVVLVTANHVFRKMPGAMATIGFRIENADGSWRYDAGDAEDPRRRQGALDPPSGPRRRGDRHRGAGRLRQGRACPRTGWPPTTPSPSTR